MDEKKRVSYAFVVVKNLDGSLNIGTVNNPELEQEREPAIEDIYQSLVMLVKDIDRQQTVTLLASAIQGISNNNQVQAPEPSSKFQKITRE